jgi:hypothetical protein
MAEVNPEVDLGIAAPPRLYEVLCQGSLPGQAFIQIILNSTGKHPPPRACF